MPKTATDGDRRGHHPPSAMFACPNPDCDLFNQFDAGNLSVCERMGKDQAIRRLYCNHCQQRFSERQGSLMQYTKLPAETVVRIIKCLGHGCSIEATADICEVDARTVERILEHAGRRAALGCSTRLRIRQRVHDTLGGLLEGAAPRCFRTAPVRKRTPSP